jgi:hypothetical protein
MGKGKSQNPAPLLLSRLATGCGGCNYLLLLVAVAANSLRTISGTGCWGRGQMLMYFFEV